MQDHETQREGKKNEKEHCWRSGFGCDRFGRLF